LKPRKGDRKMAKSDLYPVNENDPLIQLARIKEGVSYDDAGGTLEKAVERIVTGTNDPAGSFVRFLMALNEADEITRECLIDMALSYAFLHSKGQVQRRYEFITSCFEPTKPLTRRPTKGGKR
jgi:hypothetical protein